MRFQMNIAAVTSAYADLVIQEMLPRVAQEQLAEYCDVFCEPGIFSIEKAGEILSRLGPRDWA